MATYYWVGGSGTWNTTSTTNWASTSGGAGGAGVPGQNDNVIFDSASNATDYTVTLGINATCEDITVAGPASGNVTLALESITLFCYGSLLFAATGVVVTTNNGRINFASTQTGKTITTNGVVLGSGIGTTAAFVEFIGINGGWTLGSAIQCRGIIVSNGSFNTANYNVAAGSFSSNNSNIRSITLGSSTISPLTALNAVNFVNSTNLTFNAGTSEINFSNNFIGGGQTFNNITSLSTANAAQTTISGANTFNNITIIGRNGNGIQFFVLRENQIINGTLTLGTTPTAIRRLIVQSDVVGVQRTITLNGTLVALSDVDFRDINAAGTVATPWTGTRIGDLGGNANITFDAPKTVYRVGTGNWSAAQWSLSSGGAVNVNNFPLAQDTMILDANTTTGTHTIDQGWQLGTLDCSAVTSAVTIASGTQTPLFYGNITLDADITLTGTGAWTFSGQGTTQTITSAGVTFTQPLGIDSPSGTVVLADNLIDTNTLTLSQGTLDVNDQILTANAFSSSNSNTRSIDFGSGGIIDCVGDFTATTGTNLTTSGTGKIKMSSASDKTFAGGGRTYPTLEQAGAGTLTITDANTFDDIRNSNATASTITFPANTTTTVNNFKLRGTPANVVTIQSSTNGTRFTLDYTGVSPATILSSYLSIKDSNATNATWLAPVNYGCTDSGNNLGWSFAKANFGKDFSHYMAIPITFTV
jgi:hypothetical protein